MLNASFAVSQDDGSLSILFDSLRARCPDGCGWRGWKIIDKTILDLKCSSSRKKIINGTKYVHVFPPIFEKRKTET